MGQGIYLTDRIEFDRTGQDTGYIFQVKRLDRDHPLQRIGTQCILHDLLTYFHVQITRQIISYRCFNDNQRSESNQHESKQGKGKKCRQLRQTERPYFFERRFIEKRQLVFKPYPVPE